MDISECMVHSSCNSTILNYHRHQLCCDSQFLCEPGLASFPLISTDVYKQGLSKWQCKQLTWQAKQCLKAKAQIVILAAGRKKDSICDIISHWLLLFRICNTHTMWYSLQYTLCIRNAFLLTANDKDWHGSVTKCSSTTTEAKLRLPRKMQLFILINNTRRKE